MEVYPHIQEILGMFIVIAPLLIFLVVMYVTVRALKVGNIKIADLLIETDQPPKGETGTSESNAEGEVAKPPVKRSASRFILFLSGITSLILATCITTYYFYMKIYTIEDGSGLDLADFTNVLLALGIGVIPYSVNQVKKIRL